jgi:hypothetical protein
MIKNGVCKFIVPKGNGSTTFSVAITGCQSAYGGRCQVGGPVEKALRGSATVTGPSVPSNSCQRQLLSMSGQGQKQTHNKMVAIPSLISIANRKSGSGAV